MRARAMGRAASGGFIMSMLGERPVSEMPGEAARPSAAAAGGSAALDEEGEPAGAVSSGAGAAGGAGDAPADSAADAAAGAWLLRAVGMGAVFALLYELSGNGRFRPSWEPLDLPVVFVGAFVPVGVLLPLLLPSLLIFGAYAFVARFESRLGVRRQRGALVLLGFAALFPMLPLWSVTFSGVYGAALLALAVRTRDSLTAATGVMALAAYVVVTFLSVGWVALAVLGFVAVAAFVAAWRLARESRRLLAAV